MYLIGVSNQFPTLIGYWSMYLIGVSNQFPTLIGYWSMYLIGVSLGYYMFLDNSLKGKSRSTQVVKVWVLAASFW
jgi:hypothetical protein